MIGMQKKNSLATSLNLLTSTTCILKYNWSLHTGRCLMDLQCRHCWDTKRHRGHSAVLSKQPVEMKNSA